MKKLSVHFFAAACLFGLQPVWATDSAPRFEDFPVKPYSGLETPLQIDSRQAERYADALYNAENNDLNFAGRYIFVPLGAGKGCKTAAIIDTKSGHPSFLPFKTCGWGASQPFSVRLSSSLLVVSGKINGAGDAGTHFYEWSKGKFVPRGSALQTGSEKNIPKSTSQKGSQSLTIDEADLKKNPAISPLLDCYQLGLEGRLHTLASGSDDERTYVARVLTYGGVPGLAVGVKKQCDEWYVSQSGAPGDRPQVVRAFGPLFGDYSYSEDRKFLAACIAKKEQAGWAYLSEQCEKSMKIYQNR